MWRLRSGSRGPAAGQRARGLAGARGHSGAAAIHCRGGRGRGRRWAAAGAGDGPGEFDPLGRVPEAGNYDNPSSRPNLDPEMMELMEKHKDSEFLNSPLVQDECDKLMTNFQDLSKLYPQFGQFDTEGKAIYLEKFEELCEAMELFTLRVSLSSDPFAKAMQDRLNAQLEQVGLTSSAMLRSLKESTAVMREVVEMEKAQGRAAEIPASNPFSSPIPGVLDKLMNDPEIVPLMSDPEFIKVMMDIMENPANMAKYQQNPKFQKLAARLQQLLGEQ